MVVDTCRLQVVEREKVELDGQLGEFGSISESNFRVPINRGLFGPMWSNAAHAGTRCLEYAANVPILEN
jgi:hypothetical protein